VGDGVVTGDAAAGIGVDAVLGRADLGCRCGRSVGRWRMGRCVTGCGAGASDGMLATVNGIARTRGTDDGLPGSSAATPNSTAARTAPAGSSQRRSGSGSSRRRRGRSGTWTAPGISPASATSTASCNTAESSPQKSGAEGGSRSADGPNGTSSSSGPTQSRGNRRMTPPSMVSSGPSVTTRSPDPLSLPANAVVRRRRLPYYIGSSLSQLEKIPLG
jgi:hypothetical protein